MESAPNSPPIAPAAPGFAATHRLLLVAVAAVAGLAGWQAGERTRETFAASSKAANEPYAFAQFNYEQDMSDGRNAAIVYGTLGALTGLLTGAVAGRLLGSTRTAILGGLAGGVLGGILPALPCPWVVPLYRKWGDPADPSLLLPVLIHGAMWGGLGLGVGAGLGLAAGGGRRLLIGAFGGLLGAWL
ncbi:MAG: hypothetical protein K2X91_05895, partial [Thermoleophilia bacterium]|nr:hypothetical protein [Thermoleophilia bacterium]